MEVRQINTWTRCSEESMSEGRAVPVDEFFGYFCISPGVVRAFVRAVHHRITPFHSLVVLLLVLTG